MINRKCHIKLASYLFVLAIITIFPPQLCLADLMDPVAPGDYTGSLSSSVGLVTYGGWSNGARLSWEITDMGSYLKYCYTLTVAQKSPSHSIFQVSDNFTDNDLIEVLSGQTDVELQDYYPSDNSNPYMPFSPIYGIKFNSNIEDSVETVCFTTKRMPIWGNFYAKSGKTNGIYAVAYNDFANGYYVPTPDTNYVPIPPAFILGMLGIGIAGIKLRKFACESPAQDKALDKINISMKAVVIH